MHKKIIMPLLTCVILLPWLLVFMNYRLHTDMAWLTIAANRLLDGGTMSRDFYETNPPLSILYYAVPALFSRFLPVPPYLSPFLWSACLIVLASCAVYRLIRRLDFFPAGSEIYFTCCFAAAAIIGPGYYFGERDHIVIIGLFPFLLVQAAITKKIALPPLLKWPVLILGSVAILLKPHYGFLPAMMLLHRMVKQRRLVAFDVDCLTLVFASATYIGMIFVFFKDFITVIFPDDLALYVLRQTTYVADYSAFLVLVSASGLMIAGLILNGKYRASALYCGLMALCCVVPFYTQFKGFEYHAIPFLVLMSLMVSATLYGLARTVLPGSWQDGEGVPVATLGIFLAVLTFTFHTGKHYNTHRDYKNSPLAQIMKDCGQDCSFYMVSTMGEIMLPLSVYTQQEFPSRFGNAWYLEPILWREALLEQHPDDKALAAELAHYKSKYTALFADDLGRYKPDLILISDCNIFAATEAPCDRSFEEFYSGNAAFRREWAGYKRDGTLTLNWDDYFRGLEGPSPGRKTYDFKIYRRTIPY
ncbi:MAG: hypothetical protein JWO78_619 [Micavibrio sp.]|nr:hypothetical protein [Micavibrio sp.]